MRWVTLLVGSWPAMDAAANARVVNTPCCVRYGSCYDVRSPPPRLMTSSSCTHMPHTVAAPAAAAVGSPSYTAEVAALKNGHGELLRYLLTLPTSQLIAQGVRVLVAEGVAVLAAVGVGRGWYAHGAGAGPGCIRDNDDLVHAGAACRQHHDLHACMHACVCAGHGRGCACPGGPT